MGEFMAGGIRRALDTGETNGTSAKNQYLTYDFHRGLTYDFHRVRTRSRYERTSEDNLQSAATKIGVQRQSRHELNLHRTWIIIHLETGGSIPLNFLFTSFTPLASDGLTASPVEITISTSRVIDIG